MAVKSYKLENIVWRIVLPIIALVCLTETYFSVKWCLADAVAAQGASKELAELMTEWAPSDPQTHFAAAVLNQKTFLPDDFEKSLIEYEKATALSPHDYRLWMELGKTRERNGDSIEAEKALRKSLELAPNYAVVQWTLGNILLRQGKTDEAFAELRKAVEGDTKYAAPTVATASQIYEGDVEQMRKALGDSGAINSALAVFLVKQKNYADALMIWNALPEVEKKTTLKKDGGDIYNEMIAAKKYRTALLVQKQISEATSEETFDVGKIYNGGFELNEKPTLKSVFDWQFGEGAQPKIGVSNQQKHGGNLSLALFFDAPDGKIQRTVSQLVAVEAGKHYVFETFYKSNLKSPATFKWQIVNVSDEKVLAATDSISANSDWTNLKAEFTAPEAAEAVVVVLARDDCKTLPCPISGGIWFDDFSLNQ